MLAELRLRDYNNEPHTQRHRMTTELANAISALQAGDPETARELLSAQASKTVGSAELTHYLGLAEYQLGHIEKGLALLRKSVDMAPHEVPFLDNLSMALQQQGNAAEAATHLHHALALSPRLPQLWIRLGELFVQIHRYAKADQCFDSALHIQPDNAQAVFGSVTSLRAQLRNLDALLFMQQRLALVRGNVELLSEYCDLLILFGEHQAATELLQRALESGHASPEIYYALGLAYGSLGNFPKADGYLLKSLEGDRPHTPSLVRLAATRKFTASNDPLISKMQEILAASVGNANDVLNTHFALGKAFNDIGAFDVAFRHYQEGNRITHELRPFSSSQHRHYIAETMQFFDRSRLDAAPGLREPETAVTPIFVLGMPRSGTTLVEQMITTHPDVAAGGELVFMSHAVMQAVGVQNMRDPRAMAELDIKALLRVRKAYLHHLAGLAEGKKFVTDKLPGNFLRIGLLHMLFPLAPIINVQRDPMDNCLSCYFTLFGQGQEYSYDLGALADYYRSYLRIMQHWRRVTQTGRILDVPYEGLVQDPENWMRDIFKYCRLTWNPGYLGFHRTANSIRTASVYQVRQPLYRSSIGRWHNYASHLVALRTALYAE